MSLIFFGSAILQIPGVHQGFITPIAYIHQNRIRLMHAFILSFLYV